MSSSGLIVILKIDLLTANLLVLLFFKANNSLSPLPSIIGAFVSWNTGESSACFEPSLDF